MARGQAVHYLHCLEVIDGGGVRLSWESPVDEADFAAYNIYYRVPPDAFSLLETLTDYNTTEYIHAASAANQQEVQYFILTEQVSLADVISDTLNTIHLTVSLNSADPIIAALNWNAMHDPLLPGSSVYYRIMMHNTAEPGFTLVDSTMDTYYLMPVTVCRDTLFFQIEIDDDFGCTSKSNVPSMFFEDITPPPMPTLDSVSINPFTGEVILGWDESPAGDAGGYVIYHVKLDINDTLDKLFGADNTSYVDLSFDPCSETRSYALAAFDTCGNISPGSYDIPQRTILFNEVDFNPCSMVNTLSWTEYINMNPALAGYRIYLSVDGAPYEILASMPAGITIYEHAGLESGHMYQYFVRAFSDGDAVTSSSCIRELTTWQYKQPLANRIENASVEDSEFISLSLLPDTFAYVPFLNLYRSTEASGPWELIAELEPDGQEELYYDDLSVDVNNHSYYYYSSLIDSCGNEVLASVHMRTILLQGDKSGGQMINLEWNAFEDWPADVYAYEIYRAVNEDGSFELAGETEGSTISYEDDISLLSGEFSMLRYAVRALEDETSGLYSWSNEIFFEYDPKIYLPNAFTPGGQNPVYKPLGNFAEFSEYRFDVYNRWGELIFTSREFSLGWDGSFKGGDAPVGVYVCIINYRSNSGESNTLKSTFVLLR